MSAITITRKFKVNEQLVSEVLVNEQLVTVAAVVNEQLVNEKLVTVQQLLKPSSKRQMALADQEAEQQQIKLQITKKKKVDQVVTERQVPKPPTTRQTRTSAQKQLNEPLPTTKKTRASAQKQNEPPMPQQQPPKSNNRVGRTADSLKPTAIECDQYSNESFDQDIEYVIFQIYQRLKYKGIFYYTCQYGLGGELQRYNGVFPRSALESDCPDKLKLADCYNGDLQLTDYQIDQIQGQVMDNVEKNCLIIALNYYFESRHKAKIFENLEKFRIAQTGLRNFLPKNLTHINNSLRVKFGKHYYKRNRIIKSHERLSHEQILNRMSDDKKDVYLLYLPDHFHVYPVWKTE